MPGVSHPEGITRSSLVFRSERDVKHTAQSFGPAGSSSFFPIRHVRTAFYNEAMFVWIVRFWKLLRPGRKVT